MANLDPPRAFSFSDLSAAVQRGAVANHLPAVLAGLPAPVGTYEVSQRIAARLGTSETRLIGKHLLSLAHDHPQAMQSSASYQKFGKAMRRWIWAPPRVELSEPVAVVATTRGPGRVAWPIDAHGLTKCPQCQGRADPATMSGGVCLDCREGNQAWEAL